jgi:membrane-associated phospholipid phosphatase
MSRGIGEIEAAQRFVPETLIPLVELITRVGDTSTLVVVTVVAALVLDRDRGLHLLGVVIGGFALLAGLKAVFGLPRPAAELHLIDTATTGFPSGHALAPTVVYGGLALLLRIGTQRARFVVLGVLIVTISLSRIVLGVHYLVDIAAGIAIGLGYLWGIKRYARRRPRRTLAVATFLGAVALVAGLVFGPTPRTVCAEAVCLDQDTAGAAAAGAGALIASIAFQWSNGGRTFTLGTVTFAVVLLGGAYLWIDAVLVRTLVVSAVGAVVLAVLVERGIDHHWLRSLPR